jgi:uncharacterized membrane protein (DUF2068 family)
VSRFWAWVRWEFGRPITVTPVIRFITYERFVKGSILVIGGISLIFLSRGTFLRDFAENLQDDLNLNQGQGVFSRLWENKFGLLSATGQHLIAVGLILYGLLEGFEGVGLLLKRRWAEYLVLVATAGFLPLEIDEVIRKVTLFKVGALLLNTAICAYLIWRKRLFLERPGHAVADEPGLAALGD